MAPADPQDHYLIQFLLLGLPVMIFMAVMAILAIRRRWRPAAIILGAVFLLTAGRLLRDARHRQAAADVLIVQGAGLASGLGGLLLILLSLKMGPPPGPPRVDSGTR